MSLTGTVEPLAEPQHKRRLDMFVVVKVYRGLAERVRCCPTRAAADSVAARWSTGLNWDEDDVRVFAARFSASTRRKRKLRGK